MAKNPEMQKFMQDMVKLYDRTENEVTPEMRKRMNALHARLDDKKKPAKITQK